MYPYSKNIRYKKYKIINQINIPAINPTVIHIAAPLSITKNISSCILSNLFALKNLIVATASIKVQITPATPITRVM